MMLFSVSICFATIDTVRFGTKTNFMKNNFGLDTNLRYISQLSNGFMAITKSGFILDIHSKTSDTISQLPIKFQVVGADDSASVSVGKAYYTDYPSIDSNQIISNIEKIPYYTNLSINRIKPKLSLNLSVFSKYIMPAFNCDSSYNSSTIKIQVFGFDSLRYNGTLDSSVSIFTKLGVFQFPKLKGVQYDTSYNETNIPIDYSVNGDTIIVNIATYNTLRALYIRPNISIQSYNNLQLSISEKSLTDSILSSISVDDYIVEISNETLLSDKLMRFINFGVIQKKHTTAYQLLSLKTTNEYLKETDSKFIGIIPSTASTRIMGMKVNSFGEISALGYTDSRIKGEFDSLLVDDVLYTYYTNSSNFLITIGKYNTMKSTLYLNTIVDTAHVYLSDYYVNGYDYYFVGSATDISDSSFIAYCPNCSLKGISQQKVVIAKYDNFYKQFDRIALFGATTNTGDWMHATTINSYYDTLRKKDMLLVAGATNSRYFLNSTFWTKSESSVDNFILHTDMTLDTLYQAFKVGGTSDESISTFSASNWFNHINRIFINESIMTLWGISASSQSSFIPSAYLGTCQTNGKTYSNIDIYAANISLSGAYKQTIFISGNMDDYLRDVQYNSDEYIVLTQTKSNVMPLAGYSSLANYDSVSASTTYNKGFINVIGSTLVKTNSPTQLQNNWSSYLESPTKDVFMNNLAVSNLEIYVAASISSLDFFKFSSYQLNGDLTTTPNDGALILINR